METNLFGETQPAHVETRVRFQTRLGDSMLCGEGWIQPNEKHHEGVCIKFDRPTLFEANIHGVENENVTDDDLDFWVRNLAVFKEKNDFFSRSIWTEYEVLG